ncbi:MAG: Do family serine endopeptidase [Thermodesulfobacteriota bacterium]
MNYVRPQPFFHRAFFPEARRALVFLLAAFLLQLLSHPVGATSGNPAGFAELADNAGKAVVNISTVKTVKGGGMILHPFNQQPFQEPEGGDEFDEFFERFFGADPRRDYKQQSLGSGFLIDKEGDIVTNNHVVENADEIVVKLSDETELKAEIVGRDPNTDLALIRVKTKEDLPFIQLGDSDSLQVGEWVVAIGNPFGLDHTVTAGIVSAKGRVIGSGPYDDFIQTDASINPGNSGGPLINMRGEVIGINAAIIASGQGIGFAIPVNIAKNVIRQLKERGQVTRGWIGVAIQSLDDSLAEYYRIDKGAGVLITEVFPGDPAEKAGIRANDILIKVDGAPVDQSRTVSKMIADIPVGKTVRITVLRDGAERDFMVTITQRNDDRLMASQDEGTGKAAAFGIHVADFSDELSVKFNLDKTEGIIVTDVDGNSTGESAGVIPGDVIKEIDHQPVPSVTDYARTVAKLKKGESISLMIKRRHVGFLVIKLTK